MAEPRSGFREIEHTADWELEVWAPDLASLLEQAALGMMALSRVSLHPAPRQTRTIVLEGDDSEALLVNFLNELLFLGETEEIAFDSFEVKLVANRAEVVATGAPVASQDKAIKAVTYHNLDIRHSEDGLQVNLVFDV